MTRPIWKRSTIFLAAILQGFVLIYFLSPSPELALVGVLTSFIFGLLACKLWEQRAHYKYLEYLVISATVGGFGMVVGRWIDMQLLVPPHAHHGNHQSIAGHLLSFEIALMLAFCIVACELMCGHVCATFAIRQRILRSIECHACMMAGMIIGAWLLPPLLRIMFEAQALVAHFSMVIGMVAGMWSGLKLIDSLGVSWDGSTSPSAITHFEQ